MARPIRTAMEIPVFRGATKFFPPWGAGDVTPAGRQRGEDGIEVLNRLRFAADHHAVAAFQAPYPATGADVHVMNSPGRKLPGAAEVVHIIGIAPVDEDVTPGQQRQQFGDGLIHHGGGHHQPNGAWR